MSKVICAHCGNEQQGYASVHKGGVNYPLCHPDEGLDCYHLVTVYHEPIGSRKEGRRTKVDHKKYLEMLVEPDQTQRDHVRELLAILQDGEPVTLKLSDAEVEQVKQMMNGLKNGN